jgi:hypothetical protein
MEDEMTKRFYQWAVVIAYDCKLGKRGETISRHETYEAARKTAWKSGYNSFLKISEYK